MKKLSSDQIKYWYKKYVPENIRIFIKKLIPFWVQLRYFYIKTKKFDLNVQGHGEAKTLLDLCKELNIRCGYYVDIGASDGWTSSSTFLFAKNDNFSGLSFELDDKKFRKMQFIYKKFKNVYLSKSKVTPENVLDLFKKFNVPQKFEILNLDIDSYDLFVIKKLLESYKPKIISMEINEKIPPPIYFTVIFNDTHFWKGDHFFGCSIQAAHEELKKSGYRLYTLIYNNAIFVSNDIEFYFKDRSVLEIYNDGYVNKEDRKDKFSYNHEVDVLLEMNPIDITNFLNNLFKSYEGKYQLESRN